MEACDGTVLLYQNDPRRAEFIEKISDYMDKLIQYAPLDDVMDKIATNNIHSSLPPCLSEGIHVHMYVLCMCTHFMHSRMVHDFLCIVQAMWSIKVTLV